MRSNQLAANESFRKDFVAQYCQATHRQRYKRSQANKILQHICANQQVKEILILESHKHHQIGSRVPKNQYYAPYNHIGLINAACTGANLPTYSQQCQQIEELKAQTQNLKQTITTKNEDIKQMRQVIITLSEQVKNLESQSTNINSCVNCRCQQQSIGNLNVSDMRGNASSSSFDSTSEKFTSATGVTNALDFSEKSINLDQCFFLINYWQSAFENLDRQIRSFDYSSHMAKDGQIRRQERIIAKQSKQLETLDKQKRALQNHISVLHKSSSREIDTLRRKLKAERENSKHGTKLQELIGLTKDYNDWVIRLQLSLDSANKELKQLREIVKSNKTLTTTHTNLFSIKFGCNDSSIIHEPPKKKRKLDSDPLLSIKKENVFP